MKNLMKLANECMEELDAIDVPYGKITEFSVNTRAKSRWGQCCQNGKTYTINISISLLTDDVADKSTKNTIIHELLHSVDGCMNHGLEWQRWADLVNDCYNYNIKRTASAEEYGVTLADDRNTYECECVECGKIYKRTQYRAPRWYTHTDEHWYRGGKIVYRYTCKCGGRLKKVV